MAGMHLADEKQQDANDSEGSYETEDEEISEEAAAHKPVTAAQINKLNEKKKKMKRVNRFDASSQYNRKTDEDDKKSGIFGLGLSKKTKAGIGLGAGLAAAAGGMAAHQYYQKKTHSNEKTDGTTTKTDEDRTEESTEVELGNEQEIAVSST